MVLKFLFGHLYWSGAAAAVDQGMATASARFDRSGVDAPPHDMCNLQINTQLPGCLLFNAWYAALLRPHVSGSLHLVHNHSSIWTCMLQLMHLSCLSYRTAEVYYQVMLWPV